MGKYNKYAQDLNKAFIKARKSYKEEADAMAIAERFLGSGQNEHEIALSHMRYQETKAEFRRANHKVWNDFNLEAKRIRRELEQQLERDNMADPNAVDSNAIELIKTGMLSPNEYRNIAASHKDNPTMVKLIEYYATQQAENTKDNSKKADYNLVASELRGLQIATLEKFDAIVNLADYCSGHGTQGRTESYDYVLSMASQWESLTGDAINAV